MNKKALIFGVTGQDGSYLTELLLGKGYRVVGVVRRTSTDNTRRLTNCFSDPCFRLEQGDITDTASILNIISDYKPTEVYNLAAQSHVGTSFGQPSVTWDITGKGTLNILEAIRSLKHKCRYYQASSSEMFGDAYTTEGGKTFQNEQTVMNPQSPYAIAKLAAHHFTRLYRESYNMFACSGILFNHESERRGENFVTRKITKWIGEFHNRYSSTVWHQKMGFNPPDELPNSQRLKLGNLEAMRDWGYAGDYVEAMWTMLQQDTAEDFVICTGETYSVKDFLSEAFRCIEIDDWEPYVAIDESLMRPSEVPYLKGDCRKAKKILKWEPKTSFSELVRKMVHHDIHSQSRFINSC